MKVSVTLGTARPGGLDVSLLGLANQTFQDFEILIIDSLYWRRHEEVLSAVRSSGIKQPVMHVPNHRYQPGLWGTTCAGYNTGFMLAAGELIVMLCDFAYMSPDWLASHVAHHATEHPRMVVAPHQYRQLPTLKIRAETLRRVGTPPNVILSQRERFFQDDGEISIFEDALTSEAIRALPLDGPPDTDGKHSRESGPIHFSAMHTKNESFTTESILAINGMDENYDRGRGPGDTCLGRRFVASGCHGWLARDAGVIVLNPRGVMPNPNLAIQDDDYEGRWGVTSGDRYYRETEERVVANNPFDLRELRDEIWKWRAMSQEKEAIIPRNVISNEEYFAKCPQVFP